MNSVTDDLVIAHLPRICEVLADRFKKNTQNQLQGGKYSNLSEPLLRMAEVVPSNNDQVKY